MSRSLQSHLLETYHVEISDECHVFRTHGPELTVRDQVRRLMNNPEVRSSSHFASAQGLSPLRLVRYASSDELVYECVTMWLRRYSEEMEQFQQRVLREYERFGELPAQRLIFARTHPVRDRFSAPALVGWCVERRGERPRGIPLSTFEDDFKDVAARREIEAFSLLPCYRVRFVLKVDPPSGLFKMWTGFPVSPPE